MNKLWLYLGLINLLLAIGVFVDQIVRFNVWWEFEDFFHHETFISVFIYGTVIFLVVALIEGIRSLISRNQ